MLYIMYIISNWPVHEDSLPCQCIIFHTVILKRLANSVCFVIKDILFRSNVTGLNPMGLLV